MKRRAALINKIDNLAKHFPRQFEGVDMGRVEFYIDVEDEKLAREIYKVISENKPRYISIVFHILKQKTNKTIYNNETNGVKAMKFHNGNQNTRIYCKEVKEKNEKLKIVLAEAYFNKESQKNNKKNNPIIDKISNYEYEFFRSSQEAREHRSAI